MKFKKLEITERIDSLSLCDIEGDLDDVVVKLLSYKSKPGFNKIWIGTDKECNYDDHPYYNLVISGTRLETDEEFEKRKKLIEREQKRLAAIKKSKEEKDLRDYERLKAKFENK
jgi:hypothetical protein